MIDIDNLDTSIINVPFPTNRIGLEDGLRDLRDKTLKDDIDAINPIRYESLTDSQRTELKAYRQELLDVPQQSGWPTNVSWPTKPTWM